MNIETLIFSAIVAVPATAFCKYGFKYLTDRRTNYIIEEAINRMLDDNNFRAELLDRVSNIVVDRINFLVGVTHGQER